MNIIHNKGKNLPKCDTKEKPPTGRSS